jgi:hypothetical protein
MSQKSSPAEPSNAEPIPAAQQQTPAPQKQWFGALGALAGIALGAFLQYYASNWLESKKQLEQIRMSAYADYGKAQAAWVRANAEPDNSKQKAALIRDAKLKILDAVYRIIIFSKPEVVKALAAFVEQSPDIQECKIAEAEIGLYQILRRQTFDLDPKSKDVSDREIANVFGCKQ